MSNVAIFNFESKAIRSVLIEGEPWFVAADVCSVLEIANPSDALGRLDADERTLVSIEGASNGLKLNGINESGLYSLVLGSRKPEAKAFKKWLTSEVLPSIRKTGRYQVQAPAPTPTSSPVIQFAKDYLDSAALFGVPLHLAQVEAVKAVQLTHNVDFSSLLQHAPAQSNLSVQDVYLEPTPLGLALSLGSGIATNIALADLGLQVKTAGGWQLTPLAEGKAILGQWLKCGKTGTNYRWKVEAIKTLLASRLN